MINPIKTSIFELFKIGPGPSSSHTIGPMKAALDFIRRIQSLPEEKKERGDTISVELYGSLSATGKGHGTDRAIAAGLMGWTPETVDPDAFSKIFPEDALAYSIDLGDQSVTFHQQNIHFNDVSHDFPYSNTLVMHFLSGREILLEMEYYSVGGGFIQWKGWQEPDIGLPPYPYQSMDELKALMETHHIPLHELLMENEMAISGMSGQEVNAKLDDIIEAMTAAVRRGIESHGVLPGGIQLQRKAKKVYERAKTQINKQDHFLIYLNAYCLAASEENAAGNIVVTAPTSGASGVIPGILYLLRKHYGKSLELLKRGMLAAAAVGFLVKHNASISGAEMGCMGEIGTASAMGAALISYVNGADLLSMEAAAEISIEHHLGMTCDPVGGYVQIPCIERNAVGAVKAYNAYLLASSGVSALQKISLDNVIGVMRETGRDMSRKYKETSQGGLALTITEC